MEGHCTVHVLKWRAVHVSGSHVVVDGDMKIVAVACVTLIIPVKHSDMSDNGEPSTSILKTCSTHDVVYNGC